MTPQRQTLLITLLAVVGFFGLRALPDTQCAFLHADHQPIVVDGVQFCGLNEEANFYSPKALRFPVELKVGLSADGAQGELRLFKEDGHPYYGHEVAVSHTQKVHLHLRQVGGVRAYAHLHPVPGDDGFWRFDVPTRLRGTDLEAYVDFADVRTSRVMLAQTEIKATGSAATPIVPGRNAIVSVEASTLRAGDSATLRVQLSGPEGKPLKLLPIMGALGHAVVFSAERRLAGYAHMHPTLEGGEYAPNPTLSFRLRLPAAGTYDLWLNLNDGQEELLRTTLVVTP
ncbi:MAG: hypothetical protein CK541_02605 [Opitutia bacterium]|nr:MAG: hypothetical protein CK541_02605 [Opitutae bacterium]